MFTTLLNNLWHSNNALSWKRECFVWSFLSIMVRRKPQPHAGLTQPQAHRWPWFAAIQQDVVLLWLGMASLARHPLGRGSVVPQTCAYRLTSDPLTTVAVKLCWRIPECSWTQASIWASRALFIPLRNPNWRTQLNLRTAATEAELRQQEAKSRGWGPCSCVVLDSVVHWTVPSLVCYRCHCVSLPWRSPGHRLSRSIPKVRGYVWFGATFAATDADCGGTGVYCRQEENGSGEN